MSAALQQREWREKLKPKLPKPEFGSSKNGCASSPSRQNMLTVGDHSDADENTTQGSAHWGHFHDHSCLVGASLVGSPAASCFTELGLHCVWWQERQHYSFPYYHCHYDHLGPEFDFSPPLAAPSLHPASPASWPPPVTFRPRPRRGKLLPTAWVDSCSCGPRLARARGRGIVCSYLRMWAPLADGWTGPESVELCWCMGDTGATSDSTVAWAPSQRTSPSTRSKQVLRMAPAS